MPRSIRNQVILVCLILTAVPIILLTFASYTRYTNLIADQIEQTVSGTLQNNKEEMEALLHDVDRMTESFIYQQFYIETTAHSSVNPLNLARQVKKMGNQPLTEYQYLTMWRSMQFLAGNLFYDYEYINGIYLFTANAQTFSYTVRGTDLALNYKPEADEWYLKTVALKGKLYISDTSVKPFILNAKPSILFSRALYDTSNGDYLGVLLLDCALSIFSRLDKHTLPDTIGVMLFNDRGESLYSSGYQPQLIAARTMDAYLESNREQIMAQDDGSFESEDGEYRSLFTTFEDWGWKLMTTVSMKQLNGQFGATRRVLLFVAGSCLFSVPLLLWLLTRSFIKPVTVLAQHMRSHNLEKTPQDIRYMQVKNEVGILFTEYYTMLEQNRRFIKESYENRLILLDSQMKALESQINSHFLYNTLEAMNSIAEVEEIPGVAIMSKSLGDMFRYAIKTDSELVSVRDELQHVFNYISIQKIRWEDQISFVCDIPEVLQQYKVLKLILQPLVENGICHGLEGKGGKGVLSVTGALKDNVLRFAIKDDGVGMTPEQVESLKALLAQEPHFEELGRRSKAGIGLKNVHSRIQLYYGLEYGLSIKSMPGSGTEITVAVPLRQA